MLIPIRFWASFCRVTFPGTVGIPLEREAQEAESPGRRMAGGDSEGNRPSKTREVPNAAQLFLFSLGPKRQHLALARAQLLGVLQTRDQIPVLPFTIYRTWVSQSPLCFSVPSSIRGGMERNGLLLDENSCKKAHRGHFTNPAQSSHSMNTGPPSLSFILRLRPESYLSLSSSQHT